MTRFALIGAGIALTVTCWGMYGPVLHHGQAGFSHGAPTVGDRLKPLVCVGLSYFIVAIVLPMAFLYSSGEAFKGWTMSGISWSMMAGVAGALGAMGIILALTSGGAPTYVMPLVFGGAPVVNVLLAMYWSGAWKEEISPLQWGAFVAGIAMVIAGSATVLITAPKPKKGHAKAPPAKEAPAEKPPAEKPIAEKPIAEKPRDDSPAVATDADAPDDDAPPAADLDDDSGGPPHDGGGEQQSSAKD